VPAREQITTLHALATLVVVESLIRWMRLPRLAALVGVTLETGPLGAPSPHAPSTVDPQSTAVVRAVRSVRRVTRRWPFGGGSCLRESLVLGHLLRDRAPLLKIGVASRRDGVLAHAWLEVGGQTFGDTEGFTAFARMDRATR
jgi:hypothetical protein